ncbi:hypothetical protein HMN09_01165600 [Mycena chlorophos]|uniref:Uncharacterized protein n=1 Tax=Mycena chlorophos TaxID=658473 RepID=A0A8H6VY07_MYCCL|nr:hypothetical protein HMN09_01165600 [Mycena chlorophos]
MIPLVPTLALGLLSFFSSVFVILRLVLPILPPSPLSRRVAPSEFGLPNYRSLSSADQSHVWLAVLDIIALALFFWQAISEYLGGASGYATSLDPVSSMRLWIAMTLRQTCFLVVVGLTLLHLRLGRSVSFGAKNWMLATPTFVLIASSTGIAVVLSGAGVPSLFMGLAAYTTVIAVVSSIAFACVVGTLLAIKRNLAAINEESEPWPPVRQIEDKPRPSFATEEIDALRDGASWITSSVGSRRNSASAWSFSTHAPSTVPKSSVPAKSSFWFRSSTPPHAPPVPPLPSVYGPLSPPAQDLTDPDPFRREEPRPRLGSQTSWLTSTNGSQTTISAWSYPTTMHPGNLSTANVNAALLQSHTAVTRSNSPALADAKVLGGYGFSPAALSDAEKSLVGLAVAPSATIDVAMTRALGWLILVWVPFATSLPYLFFSQQNTQTPVTASILLTLSITLSSPILALNILFRAPFPIPNGLFDNRSNDLPTNIVRDSAPAGSVPSYKWSHEYKRSTSASVTVVEGRRSGDVWLTNGDAVDGKGKVGRALEMINPKPKLSVLPPEEGELIREPPVPIPEGDSSMPVSIHNTTASEMSAQFGRLRADSRASSRVSAADESLAYASQVMIAQRHYSAVAKTLLFSGSSEPAGEATGIAPNKASRHSAHLRTRSASSIQHSPTAGSFATSPSPPPSFPLPPTPPNVRAARLAQLKHKKSFSSSGFSFGAVDDMNEIDALTAGVLPLLVPGLKVGSNMKIREGEPGSFGRAKGKRTARQLQVHEFGGDFSSPEVHSTPARTRAGGKKSALHKSRHFSLPSLGLGKDGVHTLASEIARALENQVGQYTALPTNVDINRRATVFGADTVPTNLSIVDEESRSVGGARLTRGLSSRRLGLQSDVPHSARESLDINIRVLPPSAASTATLFELDGEGDPDFSGPQAESTPHQTVVNKPVAKTRPPPLPLGRPSASSSTSGSRTRPASGRRSSIVYITSPPATAPAASAPFSDVLEAADEELNADADQVTVPSTIASLAQWSSRVIRKPSSKLHRKISNVVYGSKPASPGSPGLRPLALLKDRDTNTNALGGGGTPPLSLRKKQNRIRGAGADENDAPGSSPQGPIAAPVFVKGQSSLRGLSLSRTQTRVG